MRNVLKPMIEKSIRFLRFLCLRYCWFCTQNSWKIDKNHHKWPKYWVLLRFCTRLNQNTFQKILRKWKKVSLKKNVSKKMLTKFCKQNYFRFFFCCLKSSEFGFSFYMFPGFLAIFILSSNNNNKNGMTKPTWYILHNPWPAKDFSMVKKKPTGLWLSLVASSCTVTKIHIYYTQFECFSGCIFLT